MTIEEKHDINKIVRLLLLQYGAQGVQHKIFTVFSMFVDVVVLSFPFSFFFAQVFDISKPSENCSVYVCNLSLTVDLFVVRFYLVQRK